MSHWKPIALAVVLSSLAAVVVRVRRARGVERLQLQWMALVTGLVGESLALSALIRFLVPGALGQLQSLIETVFFAVGTFGTATAIGVAILRHHLYDLRRIVNRTIVCLALSVAPALAHVALILLLDSATRALTGATGSLVPPAATLGTAALFHPLGLRVQRLVDRRFYRRKYDAAHMVEDFAARLRNEVDLTAIQVDLRQIAAVMMQPAHVSVWLRPNTGQLAPTLPPAMVRDEPQFALRRAAGIDGRT